MERYIEIFWGVLLMATLIFLPLITYKDVRVMTRFDGMYVHEAYARARKKFAIAFSVVLVFALASFVALEIG